MLSSDKPLRLWDLESKKEINLPEHLNDYINSLLESHEGLYTPKNPSGGRPNGQIASLAISSNGTCLMAIDSSIDLLF
jgi:WD40 repeat protein